MQLNTIKERSRGWSIVTVDQEEISIMSSSITEADLHTKVIFLDEDKKAFWINDDGVICFLLFSRDLQIVWGDDERYWKWGACKESDPEIEVADLLKVCWLELTGKKITSTLSPGLTYVFYLKMMVTVEAYGWEAPVSVKLKTPDGKEQAREVCLNDMPRGEWFSLQIGEYSKQTNNGGEIEFSIKGTEELVWKSGIILDGVAILPAGMKHCTPVYRNKITTY